MVSIIIPFYNAEIFLSKCVDSVIAQSYKDIEIILIDDGSDDKSSCISEEYAAKDKRIVVIHKKHEGVSIARNTGIAKARGEYIAFLDVDDMMKEGCIANLIRAKDYPLVISGYERFGIRTGNDGPHSNQSISVGKDLADNWNKAADTWWWFVWGKLYRKDIIQDNSLAFKSEMIYLEDFCFVLDYLSCVDKVFLMNSYDVLHLIEATKYAKYRMDYVSLKRHMQIHENCFSLLERKCETTFEKMRSQIALRHIRNFEFFLLKSDRSFIEKLYNMHLYRKDSDKPSLFKYMWKGRNRKIKLYWIAINLLYKMFYPFLLLKTNKI